MTSNVTVTISAETAELTAKLALAQSSLREFNAETKRAADAMRDAGDAATNEMRAALEASAIAAANAQAQVAALRAEIKGSGEEARGAFGAIKEQIETISAPLENVTETFRKLSELFLVGLGTEKLYEFIASSAELGDQLAKASQKTGLTVQQINALRVAASSSDVAFDQLTRGILKFGDSISKAEQGAGKQRATFQALGISVDFLRQHGDDAGKMLELVAQRLNRYADGLNKSDLVTNLFSLRMQELGPVLKDLAENGMAGLEEKARAVGDEVGGDMAERAVRAHDAIKDLGSAFEGLKLAIADSGLIQALTAAANATTHWMHSFSVEGKIEAAKTRVAELTGNLNALKAAMSNEGSVMRWADSWPLDKLESDLKAAKQDLAELEAQAQQMAAHRVDLRGALGLDGENEKKPQAPALPDTSGQASELEKFRANLAKQEAAFAGTHTEMLALAVNMWEQETHAHGLSTREQVEAEKGLAEAIITYHHAYDEDAKNAAREKAGIARSDADTEIQIGRQMLAAKKSELDEELAAHKVTAAEKQKILTELVNQQGVIEMAALQRELADLKEGTAAYEQAYNKIKLLKFQLNADLAALNKQAAADTKKAAEEEAASWKSAISEVTSSETTFIRDVLTKRQSLSKSLEQLSADLVMKEISDDAKYLSSKLLSNLLISNSDKITDQGGLIAHAAAELMKTKDTAAGTAQRTALNATSQQSWLGQIGTQIAQWLGLETSKTTATTAGDSERTAADAAAGIASRAAAVATGFSQISIEAAVAAAAAFADSASLGPAGLIAAPGVAAAAYGTVMGFAGGMGAAAIPSAAGGMVLGGDGLIMAHAEEMVLPAHLSSGIQAMIESGSGNGNATSSGGAAAQVNLNLNAKMLNGKDIITLFNDPNIMRPLAKNLQQYLSMNPSIRGAY